MMPQLNKITHTKKVAALSIVIVVSFRRMERRARIELATRTWKDRVIPFYERRVCFNYTTNIMVCLLFVNPMPLNFCTSKKILLLKDWLCSKLLKTKIYLSLHHLHYEKFEHQNSAKFFQELLLQRQL